MKALINTLDVHPPADFEAICKRGAVIAIGGGHHKVAAIHHVLSHKTPLISHLITCDHVAKIIIDEEKRRRKEQRIR